MTMFSLELFSSSPTSEAEAQGTEQPDSKLKIHMDVEGEQWCVISEKESASKNSAPSESSNLSNWLGDTEVQEKCELVLENLAQEPEAHLTSSELGTSEDLQRSDWSVTEGISPKLEHLARTDWHRNNEAVVKTCVLLPTESHPLMAAHNDVEPEDTGACPLSNTARPTKSEHYGIKPSAEVGSDRLDELLSEGFVPSNPEQKEFELLTENERIFIEASENEQSDEMNAAFKRCNARERVRFINDFYEKGDFITPVMLVEHSLDENDCQLEHSYRNSKSAQSLDIAMKQRHSKLAPLKFDALDLARKLSACDKPPVLERLSAIESADYFLAIRDYENLKIQIKSGFTEKQIKTLLKRASALGEPDAIKTILETSKIDIDTPLDEAGNTALHIASLNYNFPVIDFIIGYGADTEVKNKKGFTSLGFWVDSFDPRIRRVPHYNVDTGETVLHTAVKFNCKQLVKYLVDGGVAVNLWRPPDNVSTSVGIAPSRTELGMAIESGDPEMVKILISTENIKREKTAGYNLCPLGLAIQLKKTDLVKLLLENGFSANDPANRNDKVIHLAAYHGDLGVLELLIEHGGDANDFSHSSYNPMVCALQTSHFEAAEFLRQQGADPLSGLPEDWSPFGETSVSEGGPKRLRIDPDTGNSSIHDLLQRESGYVELLTPFLGRIQHWNNRENKKGQTAFDLAVMKGDTWLVAKMLDSPKTVKVINSSSSVTGKTPLMLAIEARNVPMVKLLLEKGADPNAFQDGVTPPLILAASSGELELFQAMLVPGVNVNIQDKNGRTALHIAVKTEGAPLVKLLFEFQASNNILLEHQGSPDFDGKRAYQCFLLSRVDCNIFDDKGWLPLHYAIGARNCLAISYLISHSSELTDVTDMKSSDDVKYLLTHGADIFYKSDPNNTSERSPLSYAITTAPFEVVKTLLEETAKKHSLRGFQTSRFSLGFLLDHRPEEFVEVAEVLSQCRLGFVYQGNTWDGGNNLLSQALLLRRIDIVTYLIKNYKAEARPLLGGINKNRENLLHCAVKNQGDYSIKPILDLFSQEFLFEHNGDGMTPIHYAIQSGNITAVRELSKRMGSDIFRILKQQKPSAIAYAIETAPLNIVKAMLEAAGEDLSQSGKKQAKLRLEFIFNCKPNDFIEIAEMLKKYNLCAVEHVNSCKGGNNLLSKTLLSGRIDIAHWLIKNFEPETNALADLKNDNEQNLLHCALYNHSYCNIESILELMPTESLFEYDKSGMLPIHYAIQTGNVRTINQMTKRMGEQWNAKNKFGYDVVACAVEWNNITALAELERIQLLTYDVLTESHKKHSLYERAVLSDSVVMIEFLSKRYFNFITPPNFKGEALPDMALRYSKLKVWLRLMKINRNERELPAEPPAERAPLLYPAEQFASRMGDALMKASKENEEEIVSELLFELESKMDLVTFVQWLVHLKKFDALDTLRDLDMRSKSKKLESHAKQRRKGSHTIKQGKPRTRVAKIEAFSGKGIRLDAKKKVRFASETEQDEAEQVDTARSARLKYFDKTTTDIASS
ncbi:hypothetical protein SOPP22_04450 [Shewanella sp. OPT22]|nr:hypothetical protein SOPP22_04450 [Shewanella sp. OPT22]